MVVIRGEGPVGGPGMREMLSVTAALSGQGLGESDRPDHRRPVLRRHARPGGRPRRAGGVGRRPDRAAEGRRPRSPSTPTQKVLTLDVDDAELAKRRAAWMKPAPRVERGVLAKYARTVRSASEGAVTS